MNTEFVQNLISPYGPTLPTDALVVELNKLYHSFEAKSYDRSHPEVHRQLPPLWAEMIEIVASHDGDRQWTVLDFGCGTGFEATQLLARLGASRIGSLTCYDPSPEMLEFCRQKIELKLANTRFCSSFSDVVQAPRPYDLVLTNSLMHHLPSPATEVKRLEQVMAPDAWWLMGHEPSKRYYRNSECAAHLRRYVAEVKLQKLANPKECLAKIGRVLGLGDYPGQATARAAHQAGLFTRRPSAFAVGRLVDFSVPHSTQEAEVGRGFDFDEMQSELLPGWRLRWVKTYSYMGPYPEIRLSGRLRDRCRALAAAHPMEGANFCSVWSRLGSELFDIGG